MRTLRAPLWFFVNKLDIAQRATLDSYPWRFGTGHDKIYLLSAQILFSVLDKCIALKKAALDAKIFGHAVSSNDTRILLYIDFIELYDKQIYTILSALHTVVEENEGTTFVKQIHLIESYRGAGFLSAVSLMAEIGDFSAFNIPKQLFAYFGLDPYNGSGQHQQR